MLRISEVIRKKSVETSMYYCKNKYYVPELCRWLTADSISYLDPSSIVGLNLFSYCSNDPINYIDPDGHFVISSLIIGAIFGVVIGGGIVHDIAKNNGAEGWELFGWTTLGVIAGGILGALAGIFSGMSFSTSIPTLGMVNSGGIAVIGVTGATTITITGAQVLTASGVLGLTYLLARTSKQNGYYGERWPGDPHKPEHVHLRGNGIDIRIGRDGNPLDGEKPLNSQARNALKKLWQEFLNLFDKW